MDKVFASLVNRQFDEALIRLWVLANQTIGGDKRASLWQSATSTFDVTGWLEETDAKDKNDVIQAPLILLEALDKCLGEEFRGSFAKPATTVVDDTNYALIRRCYVRNASALNQAPNLGHWCRYHSVIPLQISIAGGTIDISIEILPKYPGNPNRTEEPVRCRLSHFIDEVALLLREDNETFHAEGLSDVETRRQSLESEQNQCAEDKVHFWVAPELATPLHLQEKIGKRLAEKHPAELLLCVPGSFHVEENGIRRNTASVFSGHGAPLPPHHKLTQFSYARGKASLHEDIVTSRRIALIDTPLGLVGIAICKDFSDASETIIRAAWDCIAPDWILVPSYGDAEKTLKRHREQADDHWTLRNTRSLVANQEPDYRTASGEHVKSVPAPGFAQAAETPQQVERGGSTLTISVAQRPQSPRNIKLQRIK